MRHGGRCLDMGINLIKYIMHTVSCQHGLSAGNALPHLPCASMADAATMRASALPAVKCKRPQFSAGVCYMVGLGKVQPSL